MIFLLWIVVVLQWIAYIYLPIICFIGLIAAIVTESPISIIGNPYFGMLRISQNKAILIWSIRLLLLGSILLDYARWYLYGVNPFIIM